MKGIYRCWVKRSELDGWELVGSTPIADEAHVMAADWERSEVFMVRLDVCVRFWEGVKE
jgi:hypothetical protein